MEISRDNHSFIEIGEFIMDQVKIGKFIAELRKEKI